DLADATFFAAFGRLAGFAGFFAVFGIVAVPLDLSRPVPRRPQLRTRLPIVVFRLALVQQTADLGDQRVRQAGLGHERVAAGITRPLGMAGQRVSGQRDHRDVPGAWIRLAAAL